MGESLLAGRRKYPRFPLLHLHHHSHPPPPPPPPPTQHQHARSISTNSSGSSGETGVSPPRQTGDKAGPGDSDLSPTSLLPKTGVNASATRRSSISQETDIKANRRKSLGFIGRPARPALVQANSHHGVPTLSSFKPAEPSRSPNRLRKSSSTRRGGSIPRSQDHDTGTAVPVALPNPKEPLPRMLARPSTAHQAPPQPGAGMAMLAPGQPTSPTLETITYQHIHEMASKRISTLDYLRKAHEGRVYWFNTLLFNKPDLQRMPYFETRKIARRATNYLLLGVSLPTILDLYAGTAIEFLKTLHALLQEFDSFQQIHSADGSSSLSRARIPQMFKRATATGGSRRRTSSAADSGILNGDATESNMSNGTNGLANGDSDLLPGEEYTHLLTPSLPFDPDFYETFATLCDVLIDCYTKLMSLVSSPKDCSPQVAELFTKADAKLRKILVQGVVKEFDDSSRAGVKSEVAGVGRVVLGGLM